MTSLTAPTKVTWIINTRSSWDQTFYPSLVKKIKKSDPYFHNLFETKIFDLDHTFFEDNFLPLYEQQIVDRPDYHLDEQQTIKHLYEHLRLYPYKLLAVFEKSSDIFVGGTIFSLREQYISIALRVFDREINKKYKARTTLDYWAELQLFSYANEQRMKEIHHGKDTFPRVNHAIGLTLYKLTLGAKPYETQESEINSFSKGTLENTNTPLLFFSEPDTNKQLTKALLFHPNDELKNIIQTLPALCNWAGIQLEIKA